MHGFSKFLTFLRKGTHANELLTLIFNSCPWRPFGQLQRRTPPPKPKKPKTPPWHPNSPYSRRGDLKKYLENTSKIPREYESRSFWVSWGVSEGVFRGISFCVLRGIVDFQGFPITDGSWVLKAVPAIQSEAWLVQEKGHKPTGSYECPFASSVWSKRKTLQVHSSYE